MNISHLITLIKSDNKEFLKDYYDQVKNGITESNSKMWRFLVACGIIVICYFFFSHKMIDNVKLSIVSIKNPEVIALLAPPIFSFCYLMFFLHGTRHLNLLSQYQILTGYLAKLKHSKKDKIIVDYALPVNFRDNILELFALANSFTALLINFILTSPFYLMQILAFSFIYHCLRNIWNLTEVLNIISISLSAWMLIVVCIISITSHCQRKMDKLLIKRWRRDY